MVGTRDYEAEDLSTVLDSWYQASLVAHSFLSAEFLEEEAVRIAEQWLPASETIVSVADGSVTGFLSLVENEVGAIFVHPESQGGGHGRALMDEARARRAFLELDVFEDNPIGRRFYAAYGFRQVGRGVDKDSGYVTLRLRLD